MLHKTKKYAVVGHPIKHSKSPIIHQSFAKEFGLDLSYDQVDITPQFFSREIQNLKEQGYLGVNVTLPFKKDAFNLCDELSKKSKLTESVNTLSFKENKCLGDSTDGIGLIEDLRKKNIKLDGAKILLLGAGGAANGVTFDLISQHPKTLHILNRTFKNAELMQNKWVGLAQEKHVHLDAIQLKDFEGKYDLIINATSAGLVGNKLPIPEDYFNKETLYYDMTYGIETPFMTASKAKGAKTFDGVGMLIEQAAESFQIWHNLKPNTLNIAEKL